MVHCSDARDDFIQSYWQTNVFTITRLVRLSDGKSVMMFVEGIS